MTQDERVVEAEKAAAYAQHQAQQLRDRLEQVRVWMNDPGRKITGLRVILEGG